MFLPLPISGANLASFSETWASLGTGLIMGLRAGPQGANCFSLLALWP